MSRIGKKPVLLPVGIDATVEETRVLFKGPKAQLTVELPPYSHVKMEQDPRALIVTVDDEQVVHQRALWGLTRQLLANAVMGLQKPYEKSLEFVGVGFKIAMEGTRKLKLDVGFSHSVFMDLPEGVEAKVEKQILTLTSHDKYLLGEIAARIRRVRPPEPYKGKGIKYVDEVIRRKAGKTAKA